jgi:hypothetical protein
LSCICNIANINLTDSQWTQASLPIKAGGLGIRSVLRLAPSAFLASVSSTQHLQGLLLVHCEASTDKYSAEALLAWSNDFNLPLPSGLKAHKQKSWDQPLVEKTFSELLSTTRDDYQKACLHAASAPHSGDWLLALPISSCGLRLDDEAIRIAVCLRLGADICEPHQCPCSALVDARGVHGLSCKLGGGKSARHHALNDIIWRSLNKAGIPAIKEPVGLLRSDGKRPDGLSLIPWQAGKSVIWDATVINTLADSYLDTSASGPGGTAEIASNRKEIKYAELTTSHIFIPIAVESLGPICRKATDFINILGHRLTAVTGDPQETAFLYQRISVTVQRFNAVCIRQSFGLMTEDV